jgi:outer membrane protein OmpA-like peptidoglycan-associated protein
MRTPIQAALMTLAVLLLLPLCADAAMTSMREPLFKATDDARARADAAEASLLAPISYREATENYERADDTFQRAGSVDSIRRYLTKAEAAYNRSTEAAGIAASALDAAIQARKDALEADAPTFARDTWDDAEEDFRSATQRLERGSIKYAERYAQEAETGYRDGELIAIKANYLSETRDYIEMAEKLKAERYAPTSLVNAQSLLASAEAELNNNRYDTDKPRSLAADAKHNALHAIYVAKLENRIRNRDATLESVLLEWEASIDRLGDALDTPVHFDYGESAAIDKLLESLSRVQMQQQTLKRQIDDKNAELATLNEQVTRMQELIGGGNHTIDELEQLVTEQKAHLEQQARYRERFARVEALFDPREATVMRQGDTVIIRMIGLNFDSGTATLKPEHLQLLADLERAISEFPESRVVVEGHTDAFGSDAENLSLSQARADAVMKHLLSALPISPLNLNAMGYGETRPVANNETPEGRKRNRRIDVVIKPHWVQPQTVARVQPPDLMLDDTP